MGYVHDRRQVFSLLSRETGQDAYSGLLCQLSLIVCIPLEGYIFLNLLTFN